MPKPGNKRKMRTVTKIIILATLVLLSSAGILACTINAYMDQINYVDNGDFTEIKDNQELDKELDIGSPKEAPFTVIGKNEPDDPLEEYEISEGIINILLIGIDKQGTNGYGRSDCIMVASINTEDSTIKLASILRDNYVEIPGHGNNKINAAYAWGGPDLLISTIEKNLGLELDKYIYIDFDEFSKIMDIVGGVEIKLSEKEYEKVFFKQGKAGKYHLDGKHALRYVRIRKIDSDFQRTERQRKVMMKVFKNMKQKDKAELFGIMKEILPFLNTNLSKSEIFGLLKTSLGLGDIQIRQHMVPAKDTFRFATTSSGASIISLDCKENGKILRRFLYEKTEK